MAAVVLQYGVDRFRLPAGGLYDCFIGEKSAIPHPAPGLGNTYLLCLKGSA